MQDNQQKHRTFFTRNYIERASETMKCIMICSTYYDSESLSNIYNVIYVLSKVPKLFLNACFSAADDHWIISLLSSSSTFF